MRAEFFIVGQKRNITKKAERSRWAIAQAAGLRCCWLSGYTAMKFSISLSCILYTPLAVRMLNSDLRKVRLTAGLPKHS